MIDIAALWIGRAVMLVGATGILLWLFWWVCEFAWQIWKAGMNAGDVLDACAEWKKKHPEKLRKFRERNDE